MNIVIEEMQVKPHILGKEIQIEKDNEETICCVCSNALSVISFVLVLMNSTFFWIAATDVVLNDTRNTSDHESATCLQGQKHSCVAARRNATVGTIQFVQMS